MYDHNPLQNWGSFCETLDLYMEVLQLCFPKSSDGVFLDKAVNYKIPSDSSLWLQKEVMPFNFLFWPDLLAQLKLCLI